MNPLILCDFDGTISLHDMAYLLVSQFASNEWRSIDQDFAEKRIGSKEAYTRIGKILSKDKSAILGFIQKHSQIDPFFPTFYRYCRENSINLKIVSDGFDVYIREMLQLHQLSEIPFYANCAHFQEGKEVEFSFPHGEEACGRCGTCKKRLIQKIHRKEYHPIFYIGDGFSDQCAAQEADFVFAKDVLYVYCIDHDIPCHYFHDFHGILSDLKKRIYGIIFDLDGTLIDSYQAIYQGLEDCFYSFRKRVFPFSELKQFLKSDLETTLSQFFSPEEIQRAIPILRKRYEEVYLDQTHLLNGAEEVLKKLYEKGMILGVASNKFGPFSREALRHLGVSHYFKSVIGSGDVMRNKPYPDMIQAVLREMNLPPEDVIFVGDTITDIETGKQAGVDVYALPTGFYSKKELSQGKPKRILNNLHDLIPLTPTPLLPDHGRP